MASFKVIGGKELHGEIKVQGSKNEALQIVASSIVVGDIVVNNIPRISDVLNVIEILIEAGASVNWLDQNKVHINTHNLNKEYFHSEKYFTACEKTRGALMFMGALLARYGEAYIPKTGGDKIGARPIDTHTLGFVSLGAVIEKTDIGNKLTLQKVISNTEILMDDSSVTGTANLIMCASRGTNDLIIYNCACETYISQLVKVLEAAGLKVEGVGSNRIVVNGKVDLIEGGRVEHDILPDFIEVASFMSLAMATRSEITIKNAGVSNLGMTLKMFEKLGCKYEITGDDIRVLKLDKYVIQRMYDGSMMKIYSEPWPKVSPDILSVGIVAALQCEGVVLFFEKMYEARMFFVDKLIAMKANIVLCDPHRVVVTGNAWKERLTGRRMTSPDIRAGIALLIAALGAEGESMIDNVEQIDRGYEDIEGRLASLGALITRIN